MSTERRTMALAEEAIERTLALTALQLAPDSVESPGAERYLLKRRLAIALIELIDERIHAAAARGLGATLGRRPLGRRPSI